MTAVIKMWNLNELKNIFTAHVFIYLKATLLNSLVRVHVSIYRMKLQAPLSAKKMNKATSREIKKSLNRSGRFFELFLNEMKIALWCTNICITFFLLHLYALNYVLIQWLRRCGDVMRQTNIVIAIWLLNLSVTAVILNFWF